MTDRQFYSATRRRFRDLMRERRQYERGTAEHEYCSRAAIKLWWLIIGKPVTEWGQ